MPNCKVLTTPNKHYFNMKTLQKNFTTPEQSKRLLELGVPADSADCYLNGDSVIILKGKTFQENYNEDLDLARLHLIEYPHYIPCWSVGRLIEIMKICAKPKEQATIAEEMLYCEDLVELLVYMIEVNKQVIDFSKLEEV